MPKRGGFFLVCTRPQTRLWLLVAAGTILMPFISGCGSHYVLLHPAGPVARRELDLTVYAAVTMAVIVAFVIALLILTLIRYRDRPNNPHAYTPEWHDHRLMESLWLIIPAVVLAAVAIPTVKTTYALARLPKGSHPLVIDVTSLNWKWMFEYPDQHIATVNYIEIPTRRPVLFELTADSPMNAFWIPELGGMEYTMSGRVLPLWLEADRQGLFWGRSAQFSGIDFEKMLFHVRAVSTPSFNAWTAHIRHSKPAMTLDTYHRLLRFNTVGVEEYSSYPRSAFPSTTHGFGLSGGMYPVMSNHPQKN
ncbi:MAG: cytochrome ubiquinol oxidase subunit II [Firmicutes bacterium]|nr:cytochrome ubiquinol oxidase subunit II [Bacillota bacterium]